MKQHALLSIVIVTYQSEEWIAECIQSLKAQTYQDFELIIVDNASSDSTLERIAAITEINRIIVKNSTNLGFAAACNQGAKLSNAPWLAFLNPDTVASDDWLSEVASGIERYPQAKMFACTQMKLGDQEIIDGAGDVFSTFGAAWRGAEGYPRSSLPIEGECFSPCGAAAIFSRAAFEEHKGFDESLFCYFEDVDLGFRMRLANEICIYLQKAHVFHKGGGSASNGDQTFSLYHGFRNRFWVSIKNMRLRFLVFSLPTLVILTLIQAFSSRKAKKGHSRVILSALVDAMKNSAPYWQARSEIDHSTHWANARRMMCSSIRKLQCRSAHIKEYRKSH